jgi:4'-phosphopantetheinyl transferase
LISPTQPELRAGAVHIWTIAIESVKQKLPEAPALLSADETERWQRFRFDQDKQRFATTRQALRVLLAGYTNDDSAKPSFTYSEAGKPSLSRSSRDVRFNVTHSNDFAMAAFALTREVGIDLEFQRPDVEIENLARRYFSVHEQKELTASPAEMRAATFFEIWTLKEAVLKAMGCGLSFPLSSFDVTANVVSDSRLVATRSPHPEAHRWFLQALAAPRDYKAALATDGRPDVVEYLKW